MLDAIGKHTLTVQEILNLLVFGGVETRLTTVDVVTLKQQLGKTDCIAFRLQNPLNNQDGTANNTEVVMGDRSSQLYQLVPGQESPLIITPNLAHWWIRKRTDAAPFADSKAVLIVYSISDVRYK